jgi:ribosomal protein L11 methylase PrmA
MKENIEAVLNNTQKLEEIEEKAENLNKQSEDFRNRSKDLATKMFWKKWKMRFLFAFLIISVLLIIIVPTAVSAQAANSSKK